MRRSLCLTCTAALGATLGMGAVTLAGLPVSFHTRALTGVSGDDPRGPGLGGDVQFSQFALFPVSITNDGFSVFSASLSGTGIDSSNNQGMWRSDGSATTLQLRKGDPAPGFPAGVLLGPERALINSGGNFSGRLVLYGGGITPGTYPDLFAYSGGKLHIIALGTQAPGFETGAVFRLGGVPLINSVGNIAFVGEVTGAGTDGVTDRAIWAGPANNLQVAARRGFPAPGTSAGITFADLSNPLYNGAGKVTFVGTLQGLGLDASNNVGIWSGTPGNMELVARKGNDGVAGPNLGPGVRFGPDLMSYPQMNEAGQVTFTAHLVGAGVTAQNNYGIWRGTSTAPLTVVARNGSDGPDGPGMGPGVVFVGTGFPAFDSPVINANGAIAFGSRINGLGITSANDDGIWSTISDTPTLIAREGTSDHGPGLGRDLLFSSLGTPLINSSGNIAFTASLKGSGVTIHNNLGLWFADAQGNILPIIREGDMFDVDNGPGVDLRTLRDGGIEFYSGQYGLEELSSTGGRWAFNDNNQLVFKLNFTDGSSAYVTATVPEPSAIGGCALLIGVLLARRSRRVS